MLASTISVGAAALLVGLVVGYGLGHLRVPAGVFKDGEIEAALNLDTREEVEWSTDEPEQVSKGKQRTGTDPIIGACVRFVRYLRRLRP